MRIQTTIPEARSGTKLGLKDVAVATGSTLGLAAVAQASSLASDQALLFTESYLPALSQPLSFSGDSLLVGLGSQSKFGLAAGVVGGLGVVAGAMWGQKEVSLAKEATWKKIVYQPFVSDFNAGITFREQVKSAQELPGFNQAFKLGGQAGFSVGSRLGGAAGRWQGSISGGYLGWKLSGEALRAAENLLKQAPLPPLVQSLLPLAVGASCIVLGQTLGSFVGKTVGSVVGGSTLGLATGLYTGLTK